jgi:HlyD family secretion protein
VVTVQVGSQITGRIQQLFADFNTAVREGQIIAQIDPLQALRHE